MPSFCVTWRAKPRWLASISRCLFTQAASFDGSNDYAALPTSQFSRLNNKTFTFSSWVQFRSLVGEQTVLGSTGVRNVNQGLHFVIRASVLCLSSSLLLSFAHSQDMGFFGNDFASTFAPSTTRWSYVTFRYSKLASKQSIVLDGVSQINPATSAPYAGTTGDLSFARWYDSFLCFKMRLFLGVQAIF